MDLFEYNRRGVLEREAPLASRMRPRTLDEVVGQEHIIGPDRLLSRAIRADRIGSLILYGPPGTGKTTIAQVIANTTHSRFVQINATTAGKKDMEDAVQKARDALGMEERRTILFVDEIHRFNKAQQDYLLPFVEDGTVTLIGATTENPYFEVNRALVSRSRIFELKPLCQQDLEKLLRRALSDPERGLGKLNVDADDDAVAFLADMANGDARAALNALELGALTTLPREDGRVRITAEVASECIQRRILNYDRDGDNHYDTISAFIKSMRGSDPDAAIYYLARMLYAGEDVRFIARRIMICAAEDVGNADPQALILAVSASEAVERIGMPESQIILSQAAAYVACAPKSNSAINAITAAMESVKTEPTSGVPAHLKDAHYGNAKDLGHGVGYLYPHDFPNHYTDQQYLPDELVGRRFYEPSDNGYERGMRLWLERIGKYRRPRDERVRGHEGPEGHAGGPQEGGPGHDRTSDHILPDGPGEQLRRLLLVLDARARRQLRRVRDLPHVLDHRGDRDRHRGGRVHIHSQVPGQGRQGAGRCARSSDCGDQRGSVDSPDPAAPAPAGPGDLHDGSR